MKNIYKVAGYTLATFIAFVLLCFSAFGAGNSEGGSLSLGQIIGGSALLLGAILIPAIRNSQRSGLSK